jgi:MerR family transcriptional regulator, light-induced transcriptional regulator
MIDDSGQSIRYSIGEVCRRTGLKPDRLRAWERRHRAVLPSRSASEQRLYSEQDIRRLALLQTATEHGWSIGQVVHLSDDQLQELMEWERGPGTAPSAVPAAPPPAGRSAAARFQVCLESVQELDGGRLVGELMDASTRLDRQSLIEDLLMPLMQRIGELWRQGVLRPAHEHLATAVVKTLLCGLQGGSRTPRSAPCLAVATPAGQFHELGALLVAATAAAEGWHVLYLGPNLPAEEIAQVASEVGARAVALSLTYPADDPRLGAELEDLRRRLDGGIALIAGGQAAEPYAPALERIGALRPADLDRLRGALGGLWPGQEPPG